MRLHLDYITFAILVTLEYIFCFEQSVRSLCSTPWSLSALIYWHRLVHHCVPLHGHCLHWFIDKAWYITVFHFMVTVCTDLLTKPGTSLCSTSWSLSARIYWQSLVHHCVPLHGHCLHWFIDKAWYITVFHFMVTVCADLLTKPGTSLCSTSWSLSALIYWQSLVHHCVPLHGHCLHWFIDKAWYITVFHFMVTVCADLLTKQARHITVFHFMVTVCADLLTKQAWHITVFHFMVTACADLLTKQAWHITVFHSWSLSALIYWQSRPDTSLCSTSWSLSALVYWQSRPGTSLCSTSWSLSALIYWQISGTSLCSTPWTILRWSFDQIGCVAMVYSTVNWVCWSTDKVWHVALFNSIVNQPCLSIDKVWHVDLFNSMVTECLVLLTNYDKSSCPLLVTTCYSVHSCDKLLRCFIRGFHTTVELCQMTTCVGGSSLAHTAHEVSSWHYRNNKFTLKWFADIL